MYRGRTHNTRLRSDVRRCRYAGAKAHASPVITLARSTTKRAQQYRHVVPSQLFASAMCYSCLSLPFAPCIYICHMFVWESSERDWTFTRRLAAVFVLYFVGRGWAEVHGLATHGSLCGGRTEHGVYPRRLSALSRRVTRPLADRELAQTLCIRSASPDNTCPVPDFEQSRLTRR